MRLGTLSISNFGSYPTLTQDLTDAGLALISGPTGSGKSTIQDAVAWVVTGETAKGGAVDDVRSWQAPNALTQGSLEVKLSTGNITITRIRGKAKDNDLYFTDSKDPTPNKYRGKDITETQKLIESRLGFSSGVFLTGAFFNEFSDTGTFFNSKPKDRRAVLEKTASLQFCIDLDQRLAEQRRTDTKSRSSLALQLTAVQGATHTTRRRYLHAVSQEKNWEQEQTAIIQDIQAKNKTFSRDQLARKTELKRDFDAAGSLCRSPKLYNDRRLELSQHIQGIRADVCELCGGPKASEEIQRAQEAFSSLKQEELKNSHNIEKYSRLKKELATLQASINPYEERLEAERSRPNPYTQQVKSLAEEVVAHEAEAQELTNKVNLLEASLANTDLLIEISSELRGELLRKAVEDVETNTNRILETYFDSILRVSFQVEPEGDTLETQIYKSGNDCNFKQLSKGQRQLLRLAFSVSIMEVAANRVGAHFDTLCFDEALDGLDVQLKLKAFGLLEELSTRHSSILVIDHSEELAQLFNTRYHVTMEGDVSTLGVLDA